MAEALREVRRFHHQLCTTRVLDPACGSGNFLYVTLEHLKRLEGEVLNQLRELGEGTDVLADGETVTLKQFLGIEIEPPRCRRGRTRVVDRMAAMAGAHAAATTHVAEPVIHDYGNIECRDAVLAYDREEIALDVNGTPITRWDGKTVKTHPVTGEDVPDETAQVPQWKYVNPRRAEWPAADFIVGNPPFIGAGPMRAALGDGYAQTLRATWPEVPESADFVMYWWNHAAALVRNSKVRRFGLITTNSVRQTFNRRVIETHLSAKSPLILAFAIPDHPWVDSAQGSAVRIAMSVGTATVEEGRLLLVRDERATGGDEVDVWLDERRGSLHADLRLGANVGGALQLAANRGISNTGVKLHGAGFIVTHDQARGLGLGATPAMAQYILPYRNGRDLTATSRNALVIDLHGLSATEVRSKFPSVFQWVLERVKPERDTNREAYRRENWWLFGRKNSELRAALRGLPRYIATVETAKHRTFQFLDAAIRPDNKLIAIASQDAVVLGVLSAEVHLAWSLAAGSTLEDRPVYVKTTCFEKFPFPSEDTGLTPALADRIRTLAEQLDAHRKARQAAHESVTLTGLYNVLDKLRREQALTEADKTLHERGLVSVLRTLHDELDAAVLEAYGWSDLGPAPWADEAARSAWTEALLERLVALNAKRAAEEAQGTIRWLRPEFQNPQQAAAEPVPTQEAIEMPDGMLDEGAEPETVAAAKANPSRQAWPAALPEQMRAVADVLAGTAGALAEADLAERFTGRGPWKKRLPQILQTLEALGRARREGERWRA